ncbi:MAG: M56 family metallopeptidase [Draconibacterium sp.]|nr:M56 family metallopeptidase [Draconibacterium sp.]
METLFAFLLKASSGIVLFYIVYWFFLRKETFYTANRWFLLTALISAVLIAFFPIQYPVLLEQENNAAVFKTISGTFKNISIVSGPKTEVSTFNWQQTVLLVYLTGVAIFLFRLLSQTLILLHLMVKYRMKSLDGVQIVENKKYGLPFSFFNIVFINPKFHTQDDLPEILAHEKVHIREFHWFDLLFIELLTVIFWFNPFIWFFERSIKQNHEYLADKGVLAQGHSVGRYQAILLNQLMGMQIIGVTNNLNFALNTNRLKMMTKKKTSAIGRLKFVWALPVLALLLFAFAEPNNKVKVAVSESSISALQKGEKELTIHGKVVEEKTSEPLPGAIVLIKGTTVGTVVDRDGTFTLVDPNPKVDTNTGALSTNIVISFVGRRTIDNIVTALGNATEKNKYTFLMEEDVIGASAAFSESEVKAPKVSEPRIVEGTPPPPLPLKSKEKELAPPPPSPIKDTDREVFYIVEDMPAFPGGSDFLSKYVQNKTEKYNLKGKAKIGFTVNAKGKVADVKVVEEENTKLGKAGVEIIETLPDWKPGSQRGKNVPVKFVIIVEFR